MGMYCHVHAVEPARVQEMLDRLEDPDGILGLIDRSAGGAVAHLEKSWHGLHFLLTDTAEESNSPLGFLLEGGDPMGEDLGYGPARYLSPEETANLAPLLAALSDDQFWSRFDPERMEEEGVYPGVWDEPEEELREEYLHYFHELKALVRRAAAEGKGLLLLLI